MSAAELRQREEGTFGDFLRDIGDIPGVAPFEHNLETWRQLWRVLEMSDVILLIADARHPALSVPPALATHITQELGKGLILILNKVDLTPPSVAVAWCHLLRGHFGVTHVVPFTSTPGTAPTAGLQSRQKRGGSRGRWGRALGPRRLLEACQDLVGDNVDLSSWRARLERPEEEQEEQEEPQGRAEHEEEEEEEGEGDTAPPRQWERFRHGVLTLGCVGLPNAGKSSVLNALLGRSAVGVSRAPGRTRYFQTHYLCGSVRLCDCPGLVFPSRAPPELQVLAGVYPIAQLQDPYSAVGFLCSRLALPPLLQLRPPSGAGWTAWDICEGNCHLPGPARGFQDLLEPSRTCQNILRHSGTFWGLLEHSWGAGSSVKVTVTCQDLPGPSRTFQDLLEPSRTCQKLPQHSGTFWGVLEHSRGAGSCVKVTLTCQDLPEHSETFWNLPRPARIFQGFLQPSRTFWGVLERSRGFGNLDLLVAWAGSCVRVTLTCQDLPGPARAFWNLPGPARTFQDLLGKSGSFWAVLERSREFGDWEAPAAWAGSCVRVTLTCQDLPEHSRAFWNLPGDSGTFQDLLRDSGTF
uniref:Guanine nucleotide-binding protein-like 1 n=1 Tax=Catharus ustulatus TaxID=91951 RepID=A0A8C3UIV2_CATUS